MVITFQEGDDVNLALENRKIKYLNFNLTNQPIPVLYGSLKKNISCYVAIEHQLYKVDTLIKAVDLCFKCYHSLHLEYPKKVECVWTFIQRYVYEIETKYDRKYVSVSTLISDIERLQNKTETCQK